MLDHLISDDDVIRAQVRNIHIGDQIRVRGYLASYSNPGGGTRGDKLLAYLDVCLAAVACERAHFVVQTA